jgi:RNase P/RNase MRP subunit POP5
MLKRRYKRRYIGIICRLSVADIDRRALFKLILERNSELFGHVFNEISNVKLARQDYSRLTIISCRTESLDELLVSLTFMEPALLVVDVSGSINKLKKRWASEFSSLPLWENSPIPSEHQ